MISKLNKIGSFFREEDATTAVEYAVMLALIILACIAGVLALGAATNVLFNDSLSEMTSAFSN